MMKSRLVSMGILIISAILIFGVIPGASEGKYNSLEDVRDSLTPANMTAFYHTPFTVEEDEFILTHGLNVKMTSQTTEFFYQQYFISSTLVGAANKKSEAAQKGVLDWLLGRNPDKKELKWLGVLPGVDISQTLYEAHLKEEITLENNGAPKSFEFVLDYGAKYRDNVTKETTILKQEGDRIVLLNSEGKEVIAIEPPFAIDENGKRYSYEYTLNDNILRLSPVDDISKAAYPLVIDPSYYVGEYESDVFDYPDNNARVLVRDGSGVLYTLLRTPDTHLYVAYSSDEGHTWDTDWLPGDAPYVWNDPSMAIDSEDNVYILAWRSPTGPTYLNTRYANGTWSSNILTGDIGFEAHGAIPIAVDMYDNVHVVGSKWLFGDGVYHKYWDGTAWSAQLLASKNTNHEYYETTIAFDYNNNLHLVFGSDSLSYPANRNLNYSVLPSGAGAWTGFDNLTRDGLSHRKPCIAIDTLNRIYVAHSALTTGAPWYINISYIEYNGTHWTNSTILDSDPVKGVSCPTIQIPKTDVVYVIWEDISPLPKKIYFNYSIAGAWAGSSVLISDPTLNTSAPNSVMSVWPIICNETRMNIPATGMSFVYLSNDTTVRYFEDAALSWTLRTKWDLHVKAKDVLTGEWLNDFTVEMQPGNTTDSTETGVVTYNCLDAGSYDLSMTAAGYYLGEKSVWLDSDKTTIFYLTPVGGSGVQYPPHDAEFTVMSIFGERYADVYVNVTYTENEEIKTLNGTTDSTGSVTFEMERTIRYKLEFEKVADSINETWYSYPKDDHYIIFVSVDTPYIPPGNWYDCINFTANWTAINDTHAYINFYYNDTCLETFDLTFFINNTDDNETYVWNFTYFNNCNNSFNQTIVDHTGGASFFVGFFAEGHLTYGAFDSEYVITFKDFLDVGLPLSACRMLSIAILFFMACFFGATSANAGAVIINIPAWTFYYWGWLLIVDDATTILVLSITTTISVVAYMTYRSRKVLND